MAILANPDRLGYYLVGWKKFHNKTKALMYAKENSFEIRWVFNDNVYGKINWTIPVELSLETIYANRARQLRDTYDHLILYYSGGADSYNILYTFINNNIFIDEIVMQISELDRKNFTPHDTSSRNNYGEIDYCAIPKLKDLYAKLNPKTVVRIQDFSKPLIDRLSRDDWFDSNPTNGFLTLGALARHSAQLSDTETIKILDQGKSVCQIVGADKPLVYFDGVEYYAYFNDMSALHVAPLEMSDTVHFQNNYYTEYFYWTPDMPEIVVKQAQLIKQVCEADPVKRQFWKESLKRHVGDYRDVLHPIIYPGQQSNLLQTDKPEATLYRPMDQWFWDTASNKVKDNLLNVIKYLGDNISSTKFVGNDVINGLSSSYSKFYRL